MTAYTPIDSLPLEEQEAFYSSAAQQRPDGTLLLTERTPNHNAVALGVMVVCVSITSIAVILRAYSQVFVKKSVAIEDGLGTLAFVAFCGIIWTTTQLLEYRMFYNHQWDISVRDMSNILFALYIWPTLYTILMAFIKSAILLEWIKIFSPKGIRNTFWWTCMIMIFFNVCIYIASFVAIQFYCTPHERIWRRWLPGTCVNRKSIDSPSSVFNLVVDILILLLPQKVIWQLQLSRSHKINISIVFGIGLLAVISAAGRVYAIATLDYDDDVTYYAGPVYLWSMAECTCVMLVFCVPPIPRIFTQAGHFRGLSSSMRSFQRPRSIVPKSLNSSNSSSPRWPNSRISETGFHDRRQVIPGGSPTLAKGSQVHLANLESIAYTSSNAEEDGRGANNKIVCTRGFSVEEHYVPTHQKGVYSPVR